MDRRDSLKTLALGGLSAPALLKRLGKQKEQGVPAPGGEANTSLDVLFIYADSLIKVFRSTVVFPEQEALADVARGQYATFQFAIRSSNRQPKNLRVSVETLQANTGRFGRAEIGYPGYVNVGHTAYRKVAHDRLYPTSKCYPDPIFEKPLDTLRAGLTQPVWLTVPIPRNAVPGTYQGKVVFMANARGRAVRIERSITVHVYSPVVKDTRLWVTNWWAMDEETLRYMSGGEPVELFSKRYWALVRSLAHVMAAYRQNVVLISSLHLAQYTVEGGRYRIDFSRFDRMVELFIEAGVIGRLEGGHLGGRASKAWDPNSDFRVYVPNVRRNRTVFEKQSIITSERARSFYRQFLPELVTHLKKKGWFDIYMQHIADKPTEGHADSYIAIAHFVKEVVPDLRLVEATLTPHLQDVLDVWVPTLDGFDQNYDLFKNYSPGDETWFYTAVVPQGEYANRFIELPLIKTRLLHWINFRYGATGYLHWGFNHWSGDPFEKASKGLLPGGDPWIVYPKKDGVFSSIRLEAMRDGIEDYELLKMLEACRPKGARKLVEKVIRDFDRYDTYVPTFRETRRHLLEQLSNTLTAKAR